MQSFIEIVWVGAEIANSLYRMCVFVISYILTRGKGAPPPPREDLCGAQSPDHPVEATAKITRGREVQIVVSFVFRFFSATNECSLFIVRQST